MHLRRPDSHFGFRKHGSNGARISDFLQGIVGEHRGDTRRPLVSALNLRG